MVLTKVLYEMIGPPTFRSLSHGRYKLNRIDMLEDLRYSDWKRALKDNSNNPMFLQTLANVLNGKRENKLIRTFDLNDQNI